MRNYNYALFHIKLIDRIVKNKRNKFFEFIKSKIDTENLKSYLDIGTTEDTVSESSNYLNHKFDFIKIHKSISDQNIVNKRFNNILKKSITQNFSKEEIEEFKSDLVISNATIEHVGSRAKQIKMVENMIDLTENYLIVQTINRYFPIETHTKIPLIHFLPNNIYRTIYRFIGFKYHSLEENLNLLSFKDINKIFVSFNNKIDYKIFKISTFGFTSNHLVICKKRIPL